MTAGRASIRRVFSWPTETVPMARGVPITAGGKAFPEQAFEWPAEG
jgi:hypothetical protein